MKILHICGGMNIGGAERAIFQLVKAQQETGLEADILTTDEHSFYSKEISHLGAIVHCVGQKGGADFRGAMKFLNLAKSYDVIHFHTTNPALMLTSLLLGESQRLFYTHRGADKQFPLRRYMSYWVSGFCVRWRFNGISGNTHRAARAVAKLFKIPEEVIEVTYNGIYFDLLAPSRSADDVYSELGLSRDCQLVIGTTATLLKLKRIDFLVRAVALLKERAVHCIIVGDGPERNNLERLTERLNVVDRITFVGRKEHVGDYLNILDIFVLPSDSSESFGNSVVEAMSFGIPAIVMADGGGVLEHIPENSDLVAKDPSEIARIVSGVLDSPIVGKELGAVCGAYVRGKYTVEKMKESYDQFYEMRPGQNVR